VPAVSQITTISETLKRPILKCAADIVQMVIELHQDIQAIPSCTDQFMEITSTILYRFLSACTEKLSNVLSNSCTDQRLKSADLINTYQSDPMWQTLSLDTDSTSRAQLIQSSLAYNHPVPVSTKEVSNNIFTNYLEKITNYLIIFYFISF
jgi:hypothetical protein